MTPTLTLDSPETQAALVAILRRAARRGREIRAQRTADLDAVGDQAQVGGGTPALQRDAHVHDTLSLGMAQLGGER